MAKTEQIAKRCEKNINLVAIFAIIITAVFLLVIPSVYATDHWWSSSDDDNGPFVSMLLFMADTTVEGPGKYTEEIFTGGGSALSAVYDYVVSVDDSSGLMATYHGFFGLMKALGIIWAMCIGVSHVLTGIERGQDAGEMVFKGIAEIAITAIFVMNIDLIINLFIKIGTGLIESTFDLGEIAGDLQTGQDILDKIAGDMNYEKFFGFLKCFFLIVFPFLFALLASLVVRFMCVQIVIELGLRQLFCPFAVADIYQEGLRSPGARYLKKYMSVYLKMIVCIMIGMVTTNLVSTAVGSVDMSTLQGALSYLFTVIVLDFASIAMMFKGGELANDIVGA